MLLTMRAYTEGCRALAVWVGAQLDMPKQHPDRAERGSEAEDFVALMTPVVKALLTDLGFEATNLGVQVYGGHGYIRENGMEQYVRDARIAQIYEGTNGIQALDLVGRKLPAHAGRLLRRFFHPVSDFIEAKNERSRRLAEFVLPLAKAFGACSRRPRRSRARAWRDPDEAGAAATDYLRLFGLAALGLSVGAHGRSQPAEGRRATTTASTRPRSATARFFMERLLPQTGALFAAIMAGGKTMMAFEDAAF